MFASAKDTPLDYYHCRQRANMFRLLSGLLVFSFVHSLEWEPGGCSRAASRKVREFLDRDVFPKLLPMKAADLPQTCQLNPSLDLYREQELNKKEQGRGDWRCLFCGKHFRSEHYLDKHMHNRHSDKLQNSSTTCLADLCPIFGCDEKKRAYSGSSSSSRQGVPSYRKKDFAIDVCTTEEVEKSRYRCEVMTRRCFPDEKLQSHFFTNICGKLHCSGGILRGSITDPEDGAKGTVVFWALRAVAVVLLIVFAAAYCLFSEVRLWHGGSRSNMPAHTQRSNLAGLLDRSTTPGSKKRM